jgi:MoxR-like ATPase
MSSPESEPTAPEPEPPPTAAPPQAERKAAKPRARLEEALVEIKRVIAGQDEMLERVLVCLVAGGHLLIEGVPGLAKTLTIKTTAAVLGGTFRRIQFTPDLVPSDLVGTRIYRPDRGGFETDLGPVFCNFLLADEINRAPAKVQSALLEVMQEHQVTIGHDTHPVPEPFLVMATQNPIESEGTYPLPEAQVDRFMLKLKVGYPSRADELLILERMAQTAPPPPIQPVAEVSQVLRARRLVDRIYLDDRVKRYIVDLVFATRDPRAHGLDLSAYIDYGASPRASIYLALAAKAHACLRGRAYVTPQDVKSIGMDVLRHRVLTTYEAEAAGVSAEDLIQKIFDHVPVP